MSIRLAAGKPLSALSPSPILKWRMQRAHANDNGGSGKSGDVLRAALQHFVAHGMAAARHALVEADAAAAKGDMRGAAHWRDICMVLDRRLAVSHKSAPLDGKLAAPF